MVFIRVYTVQNHTHSVRTQPHWRLTFDAVTRGVITGIMTRSRVFGRVHSGVLGRRRSAPAGVRTAARPVSDRQVPAIRRSANYGMEFPLANAKSASGLTSQIRYYQLSYLCRLFVGKNVNGCKLERNEPCVTLSVRNAVFCVLRYDDGSSNRNMRSDKLRRTVHK